MKQYIKSLTGLLLLGASLTACVEDKDYGQYEGLTYPSKFDLGCWGYDNGREIYNVNVTLNAQGDTVCNIVCLRTGAERTDTLIFSGGLLQSYSSKAGLVQFDYSERYYWEGEGLNDDFETCAYMAYQRDLRTMSLNIYPINGVDDDGNKRPLAGCAIASRVVAAAYPLYCGYWEGYGYKELPDGSTEEHTVALALYRNGRSEMAVDEEDVVGGTYSVSADGSTCEIRPDNGVTEPVRLRFNALRQPETEVNGAHFVLDKYALDNNQRPADPNVNF